MHGADRAGDLRQAQLCRNNPHEYDQREPNRVEHAPGRTFRNQHRQRAACRDGRQRCHVDLAGSHAGGSCGRLARRQQVPGAAGRIRDDWLDHHASIAGGVHFQLRDAFGQHYRSCPRLSAECPVPDPDLDRRADVGDESEQPDQSRSLAWKREHRDDIHSERQQDCQLAAAVDPDFKSRTRPTTPRGLWRRCASRPMGGCPAAPTQ